MSSLHYFLRWLRRQHTKGANGSRCQSIYEPNEPSQPMMSDDESDEDRSQQRELRPLLYLFLPIVTAHANLHATSIVVPRERAPSGELQESRLLVLTR